MQYQGGYMRLLTLFPMALVALFIAAGCSDDDGTSPGAINGNGTLTVYMTDAPGDYEAVNVTISTVSVHYADGTDNTEGEEEAPAKAAVADGSWIDVTTGPMTVDLLTLANGVTLMLGTTELAAGQYTQVRLAVESAEVVIDGQSIPLTVPSSDIKLIHPFTVETDAVTELMIDFNAERSIHATGDNNVKYMMNPTIRIAEVVLSGGITGTVSDPQEGMSASAYSGDELVTTSTVDAETGTFTLAFLPQGTYTVVVTNAAEEEITVEDVAVTAGNTINVGTLAF